VLEHSVKFGGCLELSSGAVAINSNWLFILRSLTEHKQVTYVLQFKCTWVVHQLNHDETAVFALTFFFILSTWKCHTTYPVEWLVYMHTKLG